MAQNRFVDCDRNGCLTPRLASVRDEQCVWLAADHGGRDLVPINLDAIRQKSWQLEFESGGILGFLSAEREKRQLSRTLRPVKVGVELNRAQISHAQGDMDKNVDRQGSLQMPPIMLLNHDGAASPPW